MLYLQNMENLQKLEVYIYGCRYGQRGEFQTRAK